VVIPMEERIAYVMIPSSLLEHHRVCSYTWYPTVSSAIFVRDSALGCHFPRSGTDRETIRKTVRVRTWLQKTNNSHLHSVVAPALSPPHVTRHLPELDYHFAVKCRKVST